MTNINGHYIAVEDFDPDAHALAPGYFRDRMTYFEEHYRGTYRTGWGEFFAAYSNGLTEKGNLDYDEWAFLCEHSMRELTQRFEPPGVCVSFREKPEADSGFSIRGGTPCLNHLSTSALLTERLGTARNGRLRPGRS
jgi:hypothetical protein